MHKKTYTSVEFSQPNVGNHQVVQNGISTVLIFLGALNKISKLNVISMRKLNGTSHSSGKSMNS